MDTALDPRYMPLVLDVLDQGVFTVDERSRITSFNHAAEQITGYRAAEVIGTPCSQVFKTNLCEKVCPLRLSISSRKPVRNREVYIRSKDGRPVPIAVSTAPLVTAEGRLLGGVEVFKDLSQIVDLKRKLHGRYRLDDMIGKSPAMRQVLEIIPLLAESESTVLMAGPSGTGKELAARTVHAIGPRKGRPFVPINCAAIPETLVESELFGYRRGAFTGARRDKPGRIAAAEKGTLFLDEVGDLPPMAQVKVLRFLQDHRYEPLGSNTSVRANVRVIAATHQELAALVARGDFREDLFFRLNVVQVDLPPLADRREDIPLLVDHLVRVNREATGKPIEGLTEDAMALLMSYEFPGNVRELENIVERGFILCQGERIATQHLPPAVRQRRASTDTGSTSLSSAEQRAIEEALERHGGNRTRAAAELGIHRTTLLRKLRKLGLT